MQLSTFMLIANALGLRFSLKKNRSSCVSFLIVVRLMG